MLFRNSSRWSSLNKKIWGEIHQHKKIALKSLIQSTLERRNFVGRKHLCLSDPICRAFLSLVGTAGSCLSPGPHRGGGAAAAGPWHVRLLWISSDVWPLPPAAAAKARKWWKSLCCFVCYLPQNKKIFSFSWVLMTMQNLYCLSAFKLWFTSNTIWGFFPLFSILHILHFGCVWTAEEKRGRLEIPKAGQMSRHKEEGNDGTGAPLTVWDGGSGKALFQRMMNNHVKWRSRRRELQGWETPCFKPHAWRFWAPPAQPGDLITFHPSPRLWQQDPDSSSWGFSAAMKL